MVSYASRMPPIARSHLSDCNHVMLCHGTPAHIDGRGVMTVLSEFLRGLTNLSAIWSYLLEGVLGVVAA